jgi:hypothetical protein
MGTETLAPMHPVVRQGMASTSTYARRCRPDCPDASGNPKQHLAADGYYRTPQGWVESNYVQASQGRHGDVDNGLPEGNGRQTNGGGY